MVMYLETLSRFAAGNSITTIRSKSVFIFLKLYIPGHYSKHLCSLCPLEGPRDVEPGHMTSSQNDPFQAVFILAVPTAFLQFTPVLWCLV